MEDQDLVKAFIKGEDEAFEGLMAKYQRPLFYLVKAMVRDTEEAKDITQDAFIKAFNNLRKLKKRDQFKSWLFKIAVNRVRDHLRTKKENEEFDTSMESDLPSQEARYIQKDLKEKIKEEMYCLPSRQKEVFILRIFQDLDFNEIAQLLEIESKTARAHFHFALKKLRDQLRKKGVVNGL